VSYLAAFAQIHGNGDLDWPLPQPVVEAVEGLQLLSQQRRPFVALPAVFEGLKVASAFVACDVTAAHWNRFPGYHRLSLKDYH
jgi:hypothetical protein